MRLESVDVLSIEFAPVAPAVFPHWEPGAHIDVHLPGGIVRQYSLCGDQTNWRIAVLREPLSRGGSAFIHESLRPGDLIWLSEPRNHFGLDDAMSYYFVAGGIGITPILPKLAAAGVRGARWHLLYGGRRRDSMAFLDELSRHGEHATVLPEDEFGLLPLRERLTAVEPETSVHVCGPPPLIRAVTDVCADLGMSNLHVERFSAAVAPEVERFAFQVVARRSGTTVEVRSDQSILEALEQAGIETISSCREGICGTCETKVMAGSIDHRDSLLTKDEQAAENTMMICVSRCTGQTLELDI